MKYPTKRLKEFGCYVYVGKDARLWILPEHADGSCGDVDESYQPESSADNHETLVAAANEALGTSFNPADYPGL